MASNSGRLVYLFGLLERFRSAELSIANAALRDGENACLTERLRWHRLQAEGISSLQGAGHEEWLRTEALKSMTELGLVRSVTRQQQLATAHREAEAGHREVLLLAEQVQHLARREAVRDRVEADRREQSAADERFLAQRFAGQSTTDKLMKRS